jgi:hypothetical protein
MPTPEEFLTDVIRPTLIEIGLHSTAAEQLLLGTAMQESDLVYRRQLGNGPARGFFQMEPATHNDIWDNFLKYKTELADKVANLLSDPDTDKIDELENNDRYACAMARVHYLRVPKPLPPADDIAAMANYWKQHYNTPLGAGKPSEFIAKWKKAFPQQS